MWRASFYGSKNKGVSIENHTNYKTNKRGFIVLFDKWYVLIVGLFIFATLSFGYTSKEGYNSEEDILDTYSIESCEEINIFQLEQLIHDLVNKERMKRGVNELSWNPTLSKIAREYSLYMARNRWFEHEDKQGRDFEYRYQEGKFNCELQIKEEVEQVPEGEVTTETYSLGAENLAQGYYGVGILDVPHAYPCSIQDLAENTVYGWMTSPGHRENLLIDYHRSEGIGVAVVGEKIERNERYLTLYITENFC